MGLAEDVTVSWDGKEEHDRQRARLDSILHHVYATMLKKWTKINVARTSGARGRLVGIDALERWEQRGNVPSFRPWLGDLHKVQSEIQTRGI